MIIIMVEESPPGGVSEDRTLVIAARLKQLYSRSILPIEKKYRYDYFFDSPLLSDVEFDGKKIRKIEERAIDRFC